MYEITNGANAAPLYGVSTEKMYEFDFADFYNKKKINGELEGVALMQMKLPDEYMKLFKLQPNIIRSTFTSEKIGKIPNFTIKAIENYPGLYTSVDKYPKNNAKVDVVLNLLKKMKVTEHGNWRDCFSRETLKRTNSYDYIVHCDYSYMQEIYDKHPELPSGWNFNRCPNLLRDIFDYDALQGTSQTMIGDLNSGSICHQDDFALAAASILLYGANKNWIGFLPEYKKKFEDVIRQIPKYSECRTPIGHRELLTDVELLEELDFPYWYAEQKPGYVTYVAPSVIHQVRNSGINWAENVNFISYRWEVDAHRQPIFCCDRDKDYFNEDGWQPMVKYYTENETEMRDKWNNFKEIEINTSSPAHVTVEDDDLLNLPENVIENTDTVSTEEENVCENSIVKVDQTKNDMNEHNPVTNTVDNVAMESTINRKKKGRKPTAILKKDGKELEPPTATVYAVETDVPLNINLNEHVPPSDGVKAKIKSLSVMASNNKKKREARATRKNKPEISKTSIERKKTPKYRRKVNNTIQYRKTNKKVIEIVLQCEAKEDVRKIEEPQQRLPKTIMKALLTHSKKIKNLSKPGFEKYRRSLQQKFISEATEIEKLEKQRDLLNGLQKVFSTEYIKKKDLQGYISYEIARDYINGNDADDRMLFLKALGISRCKHLTFWEERLCTKMQWEETFGIKEDENFRIPAHEY